MLIVTASTRACPCTVEPCTVEQAPLPPINPVTTILPTFQHIVELAEPVDPTALHTLMLPRLTYVTAPPPTYTLQPIPSMNVLLLLPVILPRLNFVIAPPVIHSVSVELRTVIPSRLKCVTAPPSAQHACRHPVVPLHSRVRPFTRDRRSQTVSSVVTATRPTGLTYYNRRRRPVVPTFDHWHWH